MPGLVGFPGALIRFRNRRASFRAVGGHGGVMLGMGDRRRSWPGTTIFGFEGLDPKDRKRTTQ